MFWLLANVVLKFLDVFTTYIILEYGGSELNLLVNYLMTQVGVIPALFIVFIFVLALLLWVHNKSGYSTIILKWLALVQLTIVIWNSYNLGRILYLTLVGSCGIL